MSIRWKILVIFLVLALVPMMVLRWTGRRNVREMGEKMAHEARDRLIREKVMELTRLIEISREMFTRQQRLLESILKIQALEIEKRFLVIGTDGIWETQAPDGHMFGKERLKMLIRQNAGKDAQYIQRAVIQALNEFRGGMPMEDDVTLVVIKMMMKILK